MLVVASNIVIARTYKIIHNADVIVLYKFALLNKENKSYLCIANVGYINSDIFPIGTWNNLRLQYEDSINIISKDQCKEYYQLYKTMYVGKEPRLEFSKCFADNFHFGEDAFRTRSGGDIYVEQNSNDSTTIYAAFKVYGDFVILYNEEANCMASSGLGESYTLAKKHHIELTPLKIKSCRSLSDKEINKLKLKKIKSFKFSYGVTDLVVD